ncbi:toxin-antitoxin system YwqK family antitoxin [Campylobacter mucosalis]|uniref:toxin-antitoxin system YwqK family antitoxin n=1 Tax=Campylobacter mucosalis TaxID=202 RepID=UPI0014702290|nr:hypothetical protein [Campylobacter mucosalis]
MKRKFIVGVMLGMFLIGCGDGVDRYETKENKTKIIVTPYNDKNQIHGTYKEYKKYSNGKSLIREAEFKNGKFDGYVRHFDHKVTTSEAFYVDDKLQGKYKEFYNDGTKRKLSYYENDELIGKRIEWYPNGNIKEEINYENGGRRRLLSG